MGGLYSSCALFQHTNHTPFAENREVKPRSGELFWRGTVKSHLSDLPYGFNDSTVDQDDGCGSTLLGAGEAKAATSRSSKCKRLNVVQVPERIG